MTNPPRPPNAPTPSPPPNAQIPRWPRPPANTPKTTTPCTASPACSPTWPPSAPTTSSPPRHPSIHHDHHPHPTTAAGLPTAWHLTPLRPGVVSTPNQPNHKTPAHVPNTSPEPGGTSG